VLLNGLSNPLPYRGGVNSSPVVGTEAVDAAIACDSDERKIEGLGLIRFGGHLPKGGYDVQTDGRAPQEPASAPAIR
jgi:hypothetical protein